MSNLIGTSKQRRWAETIKQELQKRFDHAALPDILDSSWWIAVRNVTDLTDLRLQSNEYIKQSKGTYSPFTTTFPRYGKDDAIKAVRMLNENTIILDLETTGLKRNVDEIVEIAIVNYQTGDIIIDTLIRPLDLIHYQKSVARTINHIESDTLIDSPCFMDIAQEISRIVMAFHCVSYNASFDFPFLGYQFLRCGLPVPKIVATCAMRLFSAYMDVDTNISLETACNIMHIEQVNAHRAKDDVIATIELLKRIASEGEEENG